MLLALNRMNCLYSGRFCVLGWIFALFVLQSCTDAVSVDNGAADASSDRNAVTQIEPESNLVVSDDGQVTASGPIERVTTSSVTLVGVNFNVTDQTVMSNEAGSAMTIDEVRLGMFFEVAGRLMNDGSYIVSSARADSTVILCHVPRGNPGNAHTIQVGYRAMNAHLNHGDYEGACEEEVGGVEGDQTDGVETDEGDSEPNGEGDGPEVPKAVICHVPPGNPDNAHTISVDSAAVQNHLDHGDYLGECESIDGVDGSSGGQDVETDTGDDQSDGPESDDPEGEKVLICHIPPGNPARARTLSVDAADVQDHLDHGDYLGEC